MTPSRKEALSFSIVANQVLADKYKEMIKELKEAMNQLVVAV